MKRHEQDEQRKVIEWADWQLPAWQIDPRLLYHVPNGGGRTKVEGAIFKSIGVRAGIPDLALDVARGPYHGLRIEMKKRYEHFPGKSESARYNAGQRAVTEAEHQMMAVLEARGFYCVVAFGADEAIGAITGYLRGKVV